MSSVMMHQSVWNMPHSDCGICDSVAALVCAYLNCTETLHIQGVTSRCRGKETKLMLWIGLLIIVGLLVIAACLGEDITPPDLF